MSSPSMTIGELAKAAGVSTDAVRRFVRRGLLTARGRSSLRRRFSDSDVLITRVAVALEAASVDSAEIGMVSGAIKLGDFERARVQLVSHLGRLRLEAELDSLRHVLESLIIELGGEPGETHATPHAARSVVVVDDSRLMRLWLQQVLHPLGCAISLAAGPVEGAALIATVKPDLAIVDIDMPIASGAAMIAIIKAFAGESLETRFLLRSAREPAEIAAAALACGADGWCSKSEDAGKCQARVRAIFDTIATNENAHHWRTATAAVNAPDFERTPSPTSRTTIPGSLALSDDTSVPFAEETSVPFAAHEDPPEADE